MNKTISRLLEPGFRLYFFFSLLFAAVSALFDPTVALVEALISLGLFAYLQTGIARRKREVICYIENMSSDIETASKGTMLNAPLPVVIFRPETDDIIWSNDLFLGITGDRDHLFDVKLTSTVPDFKTRWLMDGKTICPDPVSVQGRQYQVFGNLVRTDGESGYLAMTYWVDITDHVHLESQYTATRPVAAILQLDNYEDLIRGLEEGARSVLLSEINQRISQWVEPAQGILCRYDRDHYLFLFEIAQLAAFQQQKFSILEAVRQVQSPNGITATLSIGIGHDIPSLRALYHAATLSLEMSLSRGGDQVVLKDAQDFQFFGGKAKETERRTKVKSRVMANALSELLSNASHVLIMGHTFPDLDVVGASVGIYSIARKHDIPAHIVREAGATPAEGLIRQLALLPEYQDAFFSEQEALALALSDPNVLLVVVDTNRPEQVQSPALLGACKRIVVIDHHRRAASYISNTLLNFHDPYASSASELSAELVQYIMEPSDLLRAEAEAILAGIVLDTKNFTMRTGGRTFEAAAFLRRAGADTAEVKKLFQNDLAGTISRYTIIQNARLYRNQIAISAVNHTVDRIIAAQAADELLNIAGIETSFVLYPDGDVVILSARSNNETNVQMIVERLGGGGNAAAAGVQMQHQTITTATAALHDAITHYFEDETE